MKLNLTKIALILSICLCLSACGKNDEVETTSATTEPTPTTTAEETTEAETEESSSSEAFQIDWNKCISDLKEGLPLDPDYLFVQDYFINVDSDTITITAVVDDATAPEMALDFADTLVRQLNLYASMQDSNVAPSSMDFYGGIYEQYNALVGVSAQSTVNSQKDWFVFDSIVGGHTMLNLQN